MSSSGDATELYLHDFVQISAVIFFYYFSLDEHRYKIFTSTSSVFLIEKSGKRIEGLIRQGQSWERAHIAQEKASVSFKRENDSRPGDLSHTIFAPPLRAAEASTARCSSLNISTYRLTKKSLKAGAFTRSENSRRIVNNDVVLWKGWCNS